MAAAPLVSLTGLARSFPRSGEALAPLSLDIAAGEFVSVVGPSGCGKSTLLRLVAGLLPPSAGSLRLDLPPGARGLVGFVFQDATLLPWATVERNVALPLRVLGLPRQEAAPRVAEALELVGLADFARAWPRELSGGMRMRVSLARALAQKPRLLLLDEPFAALDEITRFRLNDDLLRLWRHEGWTVVFVTHSVFESVYLSQRVLVMTPRPGRLAGEFRPGLPAERGAALRADPAYVDACRAVSERLAEVMA